MRKNILKRNNFFYLGVLKSIKKKYSNDKDTFSQQSRFSDMIEKN